jgi:hypothetical protein
MKSTPPFFINHSTVTEIHAKSRSNKTKLFFVQNFTHPQVLSNQYSRILMQQQRDDFSWIIILSKDIQLDWKQKGLDVINTITINDLRMRICDSRFAIRLKRERSEQCMWNLLASNKSRSRVTSNNGVRPSLFLLFTFKFGFKCFREKTNMKYEQSKFLL